MIEAHEGIPAPLTLVHGMDRCELQPRVGGSIGAWTVGDQQMLRAARMADVTRRNPFGMGSFPLVPYSNRIGDARFDWAGKTVVLDRNYPPERHAIHGVGFERSWDVESSTSTSAVLVLGHRGDSSWPWPFEARQRISISDAQLTLELAVRNLAGESVPLAFGHHPYFPPDGASLEFNADAVWMPGADGLPARPAPPAGEFAFAGGAAVAHREVDHCYAGWDGVAAIRWAHQPRRLVIRASPELRCAVVCIRDGDTGFCFEPVPHVNNALNLRAAAATMPVVAPGASFVATIWMSAVPK